MFGKCFEAAWLQAFQGHQGIRLDAGESDGAQPGHQPFVELVIEGSKLFDEAEVLRLSHICSVL
jgi:hypothetical protein